MKATSKDISWLLREFIRSNEDIYFNYYVLDHVLGILKRKNLKPKTISKEDYLERGG